MSDFALECFKCTQQDITVILLPSIDGILHVRLERAGIEIQEYIKDPAFAAMSMEAFRLRLSQANGEMKKGTQDND